MKSSAERIGGIFKSISGAVRTGMRRLLTGHPSSITPEAEVAWLREEVRVYATLQPYSSPLTTPDGGLSSGETWEMRRGYREMVFREPSVKSAILSKCLAVAQLKPSMQPDSKKRPKDKEAATWADWSITRSVGGYSGLILRMLLPSLVDGFSVNEKRWIQLDPLAPDYARYWAFKQAKSKDTNFLRFRLNTFRDITAVHSMTAAQGGTSLDPGEFLIFTHLPIFENPFGVSDLRAANRAANLIEAAIKLRSILLENFSGPYLKGQAKSPAVQAELRKNLANARARGYIVIPDTATVDVVNLATSSQDQFQQTIKDLREEIVMAIQGAYLQLLEGGIANGRGDTEVHKGIAQLFQWYLAQCVCEVINNQLMPDLVYPNYGYDVGLPRLSLGGMDSDAIKRQLERFKSLQELGVPLSLEQVRDEGQAESPKDTADTLKPPSAQPAATPPGGGGTGGATPDPFAFSDDIGKEGSAHVGATFPGEYAEFVRFAGKAVLGSDSRI